MSSSDITNVNNSKVGFSMSSLHETLDSTNGSTVNAARGGGTDNEGRIDCDEIESMFTGQLPCFFLGNSLTERIGL